MDTVGYPEPKTAVQMGPAVAVTPSSAVESNGRTICEVNSHYCDGTYQGRYMCASCSSPASLHGLVVVALEIGGSLEGRVCFEVRSHSSATAKSINP